MVYRPTTEVQNYFETEGIRSAISETEAFSYVSAGFTGENVANLNVRFISRADDECDVFPSSIVRVPADRAGAVLQVLNEAHNQFRFIRFRMDSDRDVFATYSMPSSTPMEAYGPMAKEIFIRFVSIIEKVYPNIMRACFSEFVIP